MSSLFGFTRSCRAGSGHSRASGYRDRGQPAAEPLGNLPGGESVRTHLSRRYAFLRCSDVCHLQRLQLRAVGRKRQHWTDRTNWRDRCHGRYRTHWHGGRYGRDRTQRNKRQHGADRTHGQRFHRRDGTNRRAGSHGRRYGGVPLLPVCFGGFNGVPIRVLLFDICHIHAICGGRLYRGSCG